MYPVVHFILNGGRAWPYVTCVRGHLLDPAQNLDKECLECRRENRRSYNKRHPKIIAKYNKLNYLRRKQKRNEKRNKMVQEILVQENAQLFRSSEASSGSLHDLP